MAGEGLTSYPYPFTLVSAAEISGATDKEVDRLRAAGLKGVQRIRVKDKDYDTDLDSFKTQKDACEWLEHLYFCAFGCAATCLISQFLKRRCVARAPRAESGGEKGSDS
jgi:hypothetical protein